MQVAALYDIHGNVDALDAVLNEIGSRGIDLIVVGGDIAWGPFPSETVARIQELGERALVIRGNADRELSAPPATGAPDWIEDVNRWCLQQLTPEQQTLLAALPETVVVPIEGMGDVLFCHATPRSDEEVITSITPEADIAAVLTGVKQETIVCGHTHSQFDRRVDRHRIVNAGSVGRPYEDAPGAYWAIFGPEVEMKRTTYEFASVAERIRQSDCPHADGFADAVTTPLPREEATASFEKGRLEG